MIRPRMRFSITPSRFTSRSPVAASARAARRSTWSRLVLAQHVVDEVGRDRDLAPRLLLARIAALDQPGDDGAGPEGALHQRRFGEPVLEVVAEHVLGEELVEEARLGARRARSMSPIAQTASP